VEAQEVTVNVPKVSTPLSTSNYSLINFLNTDYKILARIIADRLSPWLRNIVHPNQYCGLQDRTILDAVAGICGVVVNADLAGQRLCLASLDFASAFDEICTTASFIFYVDRDWMMPRCILVTYVIPLSGEFVFIDLHSKTELCTARLPFKYVSVYHCDESIVRTA
jgi:hypothetical protein